MAAGQQNLNKAITDKFRADSGDPSYLVELTGHSATNLRIGRNQPVSKGESPFLGISIFTTTPVSADGPSHVMLSRVHFRAYSAVELTAMKIADRLDDLLHARAEQVAGRTNVEFYDFSDSNISNRQTRWKNRDVSDFDDDTDVWMVLVEAELIWLDTPCP